MYGECECAKKIPGRNKAKVGWEVQKEREDQRITEAQMKIMLYYED